MDVKSAHRKGVDNSNVCFLAITSFKMLVVSYLLHGGTNQFKVFYTHSLMLGFLQLFCDLTIQYY